MNERIKKVYEITVDISKLLEQDISSKNREEVIEDLNEKITERGKWMELLKPPYTKEEQTLGEEIYRLNISIEEEMQKLFSDLKQEMQHVQKQKKSQASYTNPYKSVQVSDGTYLDSKN
ncbi:flagellar protein FliT [Oceanobacillus sp. CAU 1775]